MVEAGIFPANDCTNLQRGRVDYDIIILRKVVMTEDMLMCLRYWQYPIIVLSLMLLGILEGVIYPDGAATLLGVKVREASRWSLISWMNFSFCASSRPDMPTPWTYSVIRYQALSTSNSQNTVGTGTLVIFGVYRQNAAPSISHHLPSYGTWSRTWIPR